MAPGNLGARARRRVTTTIRSRGSARDPTSESATTSRRQAEEPLRNPHNSHVGVLARMGFVGAALWAVFWMTWFVEMVACGDG